VVLGGAVGVTGDAFEDLEDAQGADVEAGFLADLAADSVFEFFSDFDQAAGEGPPAFKGLLAALSEEDVVAADDQGADADQRVARVATVIAEATGQYAPFVSRRKRSTSPPMVTNKVCMSGSPNAQLEARERSSSPCSSLPSGL